MFLFVGRIVGDKGINELVEAFSKLHEEYKNTELRLVGRYEKELDPVSEETQKIIDSCEGIVVVGPKYGDDLLREYANADCFVMPSYREGFPNTVLEAGAMGLPQIVTDINGSREIISDIIKSVGNVVICKNGVVIPPKDSNSLCEAMMLIMTDNGMRNDFATNARAMIYERFEKSFVQNCLMDYYKTKIDR